MVSRRGSRSAVVKLLYRAEMTGEIVSTQEFDEIVKESDADPEFVTRLVATVQDRQNEIDPKLTESLEGWDLDRLGILERAIMRIGVCEIIFDATVPDKVAIDEAIEIAESYCGEKASKLVNGVLDRVSRNKLTESSAGEGADTD